ncbi:MAG: polysaccharide biosynthesis C-terminal domain-containing protein [Bacteroidales bacterium]|nr:polysaccharide biosynthesis C-terminal domain-containing protein [Bacteroidales bacterium]
MGAWIALAGTAITLLANFILVPRIGYQGAAIGQLLCYGSMAVLSFFLGRKYFKVGYPLKRIGLYSAFALVIYWGSSLVTINNNILSFVVNGILLLMFFIVAVVAEKKNFHKFSS